MAIALKADVKGNFGSVIDREGVLLARGATSAIRIVTRGGRNTLRAQVRQAGLGGRVANAWREKVYPGAGKVSLGAAGLVYSKAPDIVRAFDEGAVIRSANGFWLAIPTPQAPKRGEGGKKLTPSNFPEHRFGPLRFIPAVKGNGRSGRVALLVVDNVRIGKSGKARAVKGGSFTKRGRLKKGLASTVMFILVPQVRLTKRLDVDRVEKWMRRTLPRVLISEWGRNGRQ